jgi:hypothetical protein
MQPFFKEKPNFKEVDPYKFYYNVGSLLDIPTGFYVKGSKGESLLNGGLSILSGVVGRGNTFKSTLSHYMMLSAADKVCQSGHTTYMNTYDTEMNIQLNRLADFASKFESFHGVDLFKDGVWSVTDKTQHPGNEWYKMLKEFLKTTKIKNKNSYSVDTPFIDKDGKIIKTMFPTFGEIDSISEFETEDSIEIQDKNELGDSGGNMIHARLGLVKTRLLMELPSLCNASSHYLILTAQVGQDMAMQQGPYSVPTKKLQHMKMGEKIKGVTDKFFFLPNTVWQTVTSTALNNQNTKGPEYPKTRDNQDSGSQDLNIVTIKQLRNKNGPSGVVLDIIVSQSEGVLPSLTEFHYIKENSRFGLDGNNINYNLILYPDVKLGRTTVRETIDNDPLLVRAIKITSDLLQIKQIYKTLKYGDTELKVPEPQELYNKLHKKYDFKKLLQTRDYWTFNNYEHKVPYLSTMDLVAMYHDLYTPFWMK